jgi:hypothetical protein
MSSIYVFRFPQEIEKIIKLFILSYGSKICQIIKPYFAWLPPDFTYWKWLVQMNKHEIKSSNKMCIAYCELKIAYIQDTIKANYVSKLKRTLLEAALEARFMLHYLMLTE